MKDAIQIPLGTRCPQCGRSVLLFSDVAVLVDRVTAELKNRKLCIPDTVYGALRTIRENMDCRANACEARS